MLRRGKFKCCAVMRRYFTVLLQGSGDMDS